uniref:Uncharacterized protein n=1 Tax=Xiphophorus maculatus TaxID=8083 RepID=A0A3B5Q4P7_XIPMA
MANSSCMWIVSVIFLLTSDAGASGRAVDSFGFLLRSPRARDGPFGEILRTAGVRRWRRGVAAEAHGERCAEPGAAWLENERPAPERGSAVLQLRVRPFSPGPSRGLVFPGKSLFGFIRRVYRCCQEGVGCRSVKGIQSRLRGGVEFVLTREILAATASRAELHLQLSNPRQKKTLPEQTDPGCDVSLHCRYSVVSRGDAVELRVDLLFLFRLLQEAAGDGGRGLVNDVILARDVGLVLGCSRAGSGVPCESGGVRLSDAPFMAVYYT